MERDDFGKNFSNEKILSFREMWNSSNKSSVQAKSWEGISGNYEKRNIKNNVSVRKEKMEIENVTRDENTTGYILRTNGKS